MAKNSKRADQIFLSKTSKKPNDAGMLAKRSERQRKNTACIVVPVPENVPLPATPVSKNVGVCVTLQNGPARFL